MSVRKPGLRQLWKHRVKITNHGFTYKILLSRPAVDFVDENLERVACNNETSKNNNTNQCKGNLQQLGLDALDGIVDLDRFTSDGVFCLVFPLELRARMLDAGDTTNSPLNGQINLLLLPILEEDDRPETTDEGVYRGELAEDQPGAKTNGSGEDEEAEVGLDKGEVKGHVLAKLVTDLIEVGLVEEILLAPFLNPRLVEGVVVQGEDALNVLPRAVARHDTGTAVVLGLSDHEVNEARAFSLGDRLIM